jgi:hypothetical protein
MSSAFWPAPFALAYDTLFSRLSNSQRIIFIGHGPGCQPLMKLIDDRCTSDL